MSSSSRRADLDFTISLSLHQSIEIEKKRRVAEVMAEKEDLGFLGYCKGLVAKHRLLNYCPCHVRVVANSIEIR